MKKTQFLILLLVLCLSLCACSDRETETGSIEQTEVFTNEENTQTIAPETFEAETTVPEATAATNVTAQLAETEAQHTALQDKLMNDGSLTQADMNDLAGQQYTLWDTLLNELWTQLNQALPEEQMQQLLREERAWIRWKESSIALAADYYSNGSLSVLAANMRATTLTRDRVYELFEILTTRTYPTSIDLYRQVFLPTVSGGQRPDYDNFLLLLEFRGLSVQEEEGILLVQDPLHPEFCLFGSLSNESGTLTIPQLGYSIGEGPSLRGVRADFFTIPPTYYTDIEAWEDGTEVSSLEELTDYLQTGA